MSYRRQISNYINEWFTSFSFKIRGLINEVFPKEFYFKILFLCIFLYTPLLIFPFIHSVDNFWLFQNRTGLNFLSVFSFLSSVQQTYQELLQRPAVKKQTTVIMIESLFFRLINKRKS